jgi:hypothetical protein
MVIGPCDFSKKLECTHLTTAAGISEANSQSECADKKTGATAPAFLDLI